MTYLYERLGHERFQQFCQALLIPEYPDLQCFPVGQPDGGRDGLSRSGGDREEITVAQVKFKKADEGATAEWMIKALEGELPKIERLIERGAERYIMMTNASSTAHQDIGSHDLVQAWLDENVSITAEVYWRDELDRRLDAAESSLKLSYPSLLTGDDALTIIVAAQLGPEKDRIARTIRAFVSEQFRKDEEVKFRQVDLTNALLDLFVDVPINVSDVLWSPEGPRLSEEVNSAMQSLAQPSNPFGEDEWISETSARMWYGPSVANAADLLLDDAVQRGLQSIVLQGAPGQGKSTVAQYICQVHRGKYLGREDFVGRLSEGHQNAAFRLPFKVDLRDFASYLDGKSYLNAPNPPSHEAKSLEGFLASLVSLQSGGMKFSNDDFGQMTAYTPVLIFLDGLDEVADMTLRKKVIENIKQATNRLRDLEVDAQIVVTSRPSLFGRQFSLGKQYTRLDLAPIGTTTIFAYADKWMTARRLDPERSQEVRGILSEKLDQTHIRELTRNPMQLAILLNLILSIGHSLPDARTSLYSEYVKLFLTREAEKSEVVRRHRPLIAAIVEHLAWLLQSGAETDGDAGSINERDLREVVSDYLRRQDQDEEIAEEVFTNGIERVWVLVQRVEGLFEFEVQPLREYFAAKHLFATAPTSNFRHDQSGGDRSQRFEAIAANPYWGNVARFYAGFYEAGEIGALSASLRELAVSADFATRIVARNIAVELVADWIFNLKKFVQNEVIDMAFDDTGMALARIGTGTFHQASLPSECGRDRIGGRLTDAITGENARRSSTPLANLLALNGGSAHSERFMTWINASQGAERTQRFRLALAADAIPSGKIALSCIDGDTPSPTVRRKRVRSILFNRPSLLKSSSALRDIAITDVLDGGGYISSASDRTSIFAVLLSAEQYLPQRAFQVEASPKSENKPMTALEQSVSDFIEWFESDLSVGASTSRRLGVGDVSTIIEKAREQFGDRWAMYRLASVNAGMFNLPSGSVNVSQIHEVDTPLFERAYLARAYRGKTTWWRTLIQTGDVHLKMFWISILLVWLPTKYIQENIPLLAEQIDNLDDDNFELLRNAVQVGYRNKEYRGAKPRTPLDLRATGSWRTGALATIAFGGIDTDALSPEVAASDWIVAALRASEVRRKWAEFPGWAKVKPKEVDEWLRVLANVRVNHGRRRNEGAMPESAALKVFDEPDKYSAAVLRAAQVSTLNRYRPQPVGEIAAEAGWTLG